MCASVLAFRAVLRAYALVLEVHAPTPQFLARIFCLREHYFTDFSNSQIFPFIKKNYWWLRRFREIKTRRIKFVTDESAEAT